MRKIGWPEAIMMAFAGWLLSPSPCHAQTKCPWLNAATAAGILGGDVQMSLRKATTLVESKGAGAANYPDQIRTDRFDVACTFTHQGEASISMLRIVVKTMTSPSADFPMLLASCPGKQLPLRAIGSEAIQCVIDRSGHAGNGNEEQVIARVRERAFVLTIHREEKPPAPGEGGMLSEGTRNVAEQVAGSLF